MEELYQLIALLNTKITALEGKGETPPEEVKPEETTPVAITGP